MGRNVESREHSREVHPESMSTLGLLNRNMTNTR